VAHQQGVLAEIATAVSRARGNITGLKLTARTPELFDMIFDVEVHDASHLYNIIAAVRTCPSVSHAERAVSPGR